MKKIAVITGASSGMGRQFAKTVDSFGVPVDEVWVIARRADRLAALECPYSVRAIPMDLTGRQSFQKYAELLKNENPEIVLLVNASGYGKFGASADIPLEDSLNLVDLNCQAVQAMCWLSIPYMKRGSAIINIASIAALQPVPYINVYAASKAFVLSYSRGLNRELAPSGIRVMALCPYWTKTEFFDRAVTDKKNDVVKKYIVMYRSEDVVNRAWRDVKRGKDVCKYGFISKGQAVLCKLLPHRFVMDVWMKQQKL